MWKMTKREAIKTVLSFWVILAVFAVPVTGMHVVGSWLASMGLAWLGLTLTFLLLPVIAVASTPMVDRLMAWAADED